MEHLGLIILITVIFYSFVAAFAIAKKDINRPKLFYYSAAVWFVAVFCLAKFLPENTPSVINFVPFAAMFGQGGGEKFIEFILSALLFVPFGFILSIYGTKRDEEFLFIKLFLFVMIVSITSELIQLFPLGKTASLDHVVAETAGASLGYLLFLIIFASKKMKEIIKKI